MSVRCVGFAELSSVQAYELWRLRQDVFIVEQSSPYPDLDGRDLEPTTVHVLATIDGVLAGCARVLEDLEVHRIGRVVVAPAARGRGVAGQLMEAALAAGGGTAVELDAQTYLAGWYGSYGFEVVGDEFDEDGVLHVPMRREA